MRIIESYQVPEGNVSQDIFSLPCVNSARKKNGIEYGVFVNGTSAYPSMARAKPTDWICKTDNGEWIVLTNDEYEEATKEEKHESIRKIVLEEWDKGNLVFADIDGLKSIKFDDFIKQPIEGMLYDINRSLPIILSMEDPKWVNDFATVKLLVHFYEQCEKLKEENIYLKDELLKSTPTKLWALKSSNNEEATKTPQG